MHEYMNITACDVGGGNDQLQSGKDVRCTMRIKIILARTTMGVAHPALLHFASPHFLLGIHILWWMVCFPAVAQRLDRIGQF